MLWLISRSALLCFLIGDLWFLALHNLFWVYFVYDVRKFLISLFTCSCAVFPAPLYWRNCLFPHCFACFIIDKLTISVWVYFWTLYSVAFIYMSGFVTVPYCFDYCSFVELSEVRKCDTSSFVLFSQNCFGYLVDQVFFLILYGRISINGLNKSPKINITICPSVLVFQHCTVRLHLSWKTFLLNYSDSNLFK